MASRDFTVHLSSQLFRAPPAAWISSSGGLHGPGSRSAQDMRLRALGVSRMTNPGSSQAWMESPSHSTELHYDPTDNTHVHSHGPTCQLLCTPWGPCLSPGAPAHPSMGFILKGSRDSFVLIQSKNKGLDMLVPIRPEVNIRNTGTSPELPSSSPSWASMVTLSAGDGEAPSGKGASGQVRHLRVRKM